MSSFKMFLNLSLLETMLEKLFIKGTMLPEEGFFFSPHT